MIRKDYPALDEAVFRETLPNGLQILVVPRRGFTRKLAYFVTDYGSVHRRFTLNGQEIEAPAGVAHFLEHKMFDLPGRDVSAEFAALGASVNAFTSYDMTAYYFGCTENFEEALHLLLEFVSTAYFTQETVDKEQGIIGQEIGMNADNPDTRVFETLMQSMYENHPIREPILGTVDSIAKITAETLHQCHRAFYRPGNMVLCVVGDVDAQSIADIAGEVLPDDAGDSVLCCRSWPEDMAVKTGYTQQTMEVAMPMFQLGFKCESAGRGEGAIRLEIAADLAAEALFGESSQLYLKLYEQGLIDSSFGGGFETVDGMSMLTCGGDSDDPEAVRDAVLARARELVQQGIDHSEFLRMKRSAMGRRIRSLDSFDGTCFRLCAYHLCGFDYFRFPEIYASVTEEDLRTFINRTVVPQRCSLSVIMPANQEE